jgi:hypothetical protein
VIYLFEGTLPLKTFTAFRGTASVAPAICVNRDVKQFVYYANVTRVSKPDDRRSSVLTRYPIHFWQPFQAAFKALNSTFVGDGYFRAALYEKELYVEVMYQADYTAQYRDRCRSYWWDTNSRNWVSMQRVRLLTPKAIYKHYARMLRQKRLADMSVR